MADVRLESLGTLARAPIKGVLIEIVMPHCGAKFKFPIMCFGFLLVLNLWNWNQGCVD